VKGDSSAAHAESHTASRGLLFRNIILGGQDGIVNVLGIVLGVAAATQSNQMVLLASLTATIAESISMAAVAYTSIRAQLEHYESEVNRELEEMRTIPHMEREEIVRIYEAKGFSGKLLSQVVDKITSNKKVWLDTMMQEELMLENPALSMSPLMQSILVGVSALVGSLIPIAPFFFMENAPASLWALAASFSALFLVGACKSKMTSGKWLRGGLELMAIGGAAALAGYFVGTLFQM